MARTKQTARSSHIPQTSQRSQKSEKLEVDGDTQPLLDAEGNPIPWAEPGTICDIRNLYETEPDRNGRTSWTTMYPDDLDDPPENAEAAQYALIVRKKKCYDGRRKLQVDSIVIQSPFLKDALRKVLKDYPGVTILDRLEFDPPFTSLVHRWERFVDVWKNETDPTARQHLDLLGNVLEEELRDTIREKDDHVVHGVITFSNLWTIFEPGCFVYGQEDDHDRIYKLTSGHMTQTQCGPAYQLQCRYVDFDGDKFGWGNTNLLIRGWTGTRSITKLSAFPLDFHPKQQKVKDHLIARGKLFQSYKGYHFKEYDGIALGPGMCGMIRYTINSRVIIDTYAFNRFNPNRKVNLSYIGQTDDGDDEDEDDMEYLTHSELLNGATKQSKDEDDSQPHEKNALTDEQSMLCTHTLHGYSLRDKKWLLLFIPLVKNISWNEEAFASLVAPPEQKELILAFAQTQAANKGSFDDVIKGKGKGIIMLLSGPPGVGKTLTAESVAENMKVPLYCMSAGDLGEQSLPHSQTSLITALGTSSGQVESALSNVLEMATKWNAVLLLDEADVFLEARSTHDLERNKLVSIFLRLLEYYEGILFLTTNRVDNIDAAFESRIHLSLQYDDLDFASRKHVWETFLLRSPGGGLAEGPGAAGVEGFEDEEIDELAREVLNGRQIKNILKTAGLLAQRKESGLKFSHVMTVLKLRKAHARAKKRGIDEV